MICCIVLCCFVLYCFEMYSNGLYCTLLLQPLGSQDQTLQTRKLWLVVGRRPTGPLLLPPVTLDLPECEEPKKKENEKKRKKK